MKEKKEKQPDQNITMYNLGKKKAPLSSFCPDKKKKTYIQGQSVVIHLSSRSCV